MSISTVGKVEVLSAVGSVGAGILGAIFLEPILLIGAAVAALAATGLQLRESHLRKEEEKARVSSGYGHAA